MSAHLPARAALVLVVLAVAALVAACGGSSESSTEATASLKPLVKAESNAGEMGEMETKGEGTVEMEGMEMQPTNAHGKVELTQSGDHLTGTIEVVGLEPNSDHAEHLHGPGGACSPMSRITPNMAVVLPDLEADAAGVARAEVDATVHQNVLGSGYFVMVHRNPTPANLRGQIGTAPASEAFMQVLAKDPMMLCGDLRAAD